MNVDFRCPKTVEYKEFYKFLTKELEPCLPLVYVAIICTMQIVNENENSKKCYINYLNPCSIAPLRV